MHDHRLLAWTGAAISVGVIATAVIIVPVAATSGKATPHIVAHPDNVMVLRTTKLNGSSFPAKSKITIEECASTFWIAPQDPCDTTNSIQVKTNAGGHFQSVLTVHACAANNTTPGFSQTCYIGEPKGTGVDTEALVGAVAITVTGP
jgi:hypothetical protein